MTEVVRFRCNNCGERFEAEAMTDEEKAEARDKSRPTSAIRCPRCGRTDIRRGWD